MADRSEKPEDQSLMQLRVSVAKLDEQIKDLLSALSGARRKRALMARAVEAIEEAREVDEGGTEIEGSRHKETLKDQILTVLQIEAPEGLTTRQIHQALQDMLQELVNLSSIQTYLSRLNKDEAIIRKDGRWHIRPKR